MERLRIMANAQINPLLIDLLVDQEASQISDTPTMSSLPGKYVKAISRNKKILIPPIEENHHMLTCKSCGRKGKYDVGIIVVNVDKKEKTEKISDDLQMTGYFRCKHCNAAGNWELPHSLLMLAMIGALSVEDGRIMVGKSLLFDGSSHKYATDGEEYLLHLLKENPQDAFIWNRLGNLYHKGNRPELAISVFEHSLLIDPGQTESHFTIGDLLAQISDLPNAGYHFRQMLLSAEAYRKIPAVKLREILANGLHALFLMNQHTNGEVPFLPTVEEREESERKSAPTILAGLELEIFPDDLESFFPLAEMYMGARAKEIPIRERTFNVTNPSTVALKQKKRKGKKKKKRK